MWPMFLRNPPAVMRFTNFAAAPVAKRIAWSKMLARQPAAGAAESDVLKERSLRKYVGDYALFVSGIFRKHVEGSGSLDYYIQEGSRSYWIWSPSSTSRSTGRGTFLYQELSKKFEYYSGALDYTRKAYFAAAPGEDPFAGFMRQVEGWIKVNITESQLAALFRNPRSLIFLFPSDARS